MRRCQTGPYYCNFEIICQKTTKPTFKTWSRPSWTPPQIQGRCTRIRRGLQETSSSENRYAPNAIVRLYLPAQLPGQVQHWQRKILNQERGDSFLQKTRMTTADLSLVLTILGIAYSVFNIPSNFMKRYVKPGLLKLC
jgi:hypothetical protein